MARASKAALAALGLLVLLMRRLSLTLPQLRVALPDLPPALAAEYLEPLNAALHEAGATTRARAAAFIAQLAHESMQLRALEEFASGAAYEGRADLGNVEPGDGMRYKGRGPIQLTGRANYRAAGRALGLDLEGQPELAATPAVGFRVAAWYWRTRGLNALADAGDHEAITRAINGGLNGYASRLTHLRRATAALGGVA